jgi:hypothetical protein
MAMGKGKEGRDRVSPRESRIENRESTPFVHLSSSSFTAVFTTFIPHYILVKYLSTSE